MFAPAVARGQAERFVIKAGTVIDGKGNVLRHAAIVVEGSSVVRIDANPGSAPHDFSAPTLLPGLIDTHVHSSSHFGWNGRAASEGETAAQSILYSAENAYITLMAGWA